MSAITPYQPADMPQAMQLAHLVVKSGMAPSIRTPEAAFLVLALAADLGLNASQALRGIQVISGKACPTADCLVACVLRSGLAEYFVEIETTTESSTWETHRKGEPRPRRSAFTLADAKIAGLTGENWKKYPQRMLKARAKAFLARDVYPDLTLGLYTQEEIQGVEPIIEEITPHVDLSAAATIEELRALANQAVRDGGLVEEVRVRFEARLKELEK